MTEKQTKQLEKLMSNLADKLKGNRISVINGYIQDGYYIAVYDHNGEILSEKSGPTIWSIVRQYDAGV